MTAKANLIAAIKTVSISYDNPATAVLETRLLLTHDQIEFVYRNDDAEMTEALHIVLSADPEDLGAALCDVITESVKHTPDPASNDRVHRQAQLKGLNRCRP